MEQFKSKGAKDLLYSIKGGLPISYDSLMEEIASNPTLLKNSDDIQWAPPLGFIIKTSSNSSEVTDYFAVNSELGIATCKHGSEVSISDLLEDADAYANYSLHAHEQFTERMPNSDAKQLTLEMAVIKEDTFIVHPDFPGGFVFAKRSQVPRKFLDEAFVVERSDRKNQDQITHQLKAAVEAQHEVEKLEEESLWESTIEDAIEAIMKSKKQNVKQNLN